MKNYKFLVLWFLVVVSETLFSAPPPPPSGGPGCWPPPCIPVDNGLIFLIVAGTALVGWKLLNLKKTGKLIS